MKGWWLMKSEMSSLDKPWGDRQWWWSWRVQYWRFVKDQRIETGRWSTQPWQDSHSCRGRQWAALIKDIGIDVHWSAVHSLHINPSILILYTNKGSFIIILDRSDYLAEADRQLVDRSIYQPLSYDLRRPSAFNSPASTSLMVIVWTTFLMMKYMTKLTHSEKYWRSKKTQ